MARGLPKGNNPIKFEKDRGFLHPLPRSHPSRHIYTRKAQQYRHRIDGKYKVAFKLHVTLSGDTYEEDRKVIASGLYKGGFAFKMYPLRGQSSDQDRSFTIYPKTEKDLLSIVLTIINVAGAHGATPGVPSKDGVIVPGTNGLVTYHVERVDEQLLRDMDAAGALSEKSKEKLYWGGQLHQTSIDYIVKKNSGYLSAVEGYGSVRLDAMKFLLKKGPLGFLY
tara:strand:+ start:336 stop:1001 length:666 start_codon:yes stop_codon:yes gene_type:complete